MKEVKRKPYYKTKYNDKDIKHIILKSRYKNFVIKIINKYYRRFINNSSITKNDLVQEGILAMIKAIKDYDFTYGRKLSSHIFQRVRTYIGYYIRDNYLIFGLPQRTKISYIKEIEDDNKIIRLDKKNNEYDATPGNYNNKTEKFNFELSKIIEDDLNINDDVEILYKALEYLKKDEAEIIRRRFLNDFKVNRDVMAKYFGVSHVTYYHNVELPILKKYIKICKELENE